MEGCSTGILIEIDTENNDDKCTYADNSIILSDFEKGFAVGLATATRKYKSKSICCPLEENKHNGDLFCSEIFKLTNCPSRINNNIPIIKKLSDKSSKDKSSGVANEDRWIDIVNCDGDLLLENEKFDFSISLSDDTSRTDDDVFYAQSEGSNEGRKIKTAVKKQIRKNIGSKQIQRNINENKENFEDILQKSLNERIASVNLVTKSQETSEENMDERILPGCSLVRQNTFTLSTDSDSLSTSSSKNQEAKTNQCKVQSRNIKRATSNILPQTNKPLSTRPVNRSSTSVEKQSKLAHTEYSNRNLTSKVTRPNTAKRSLKDLELSSHSENQASKKSNFISVSNMSSVDSNSSGSQSKIIGMNSRNFASSGKCLNRSHGKKIEPLKATLPVHQMTKSGLRPPTRCSVNTKPESKINKGSNSSRVPHQSQATSDSSISFTSQRRSLNISAIPTLTSTPNRRSTSNSSMSSTPSLRPFLKTSGLPTPIRLLNSSDIKI